MSENVLKQAALVQAQVILGQCIVWSYKGAMSEQLIKILN